MRAHASLLGATLALAGCGADAGGSPAPPAAHHACADQATWMLSFGGEGRRWPGHLATDASCAVVTTGAALGAPLVGGAEALPVGSGGAQYAAKVGSDGEVAWAVALGTASFVHDSPGGVSDVAVAALASGDFVVAGTLEGDLDAPGGALHAGGGAPFVARLDGARGAVVWATLLPGADTTIAGLGVDAAGRIVVAGSFSGTIDLGAGALTSAGGRDAFIARYDAAGPIAASARLGDAQDDEARSLAITPGGVVVLGGSTAGHAVDPCSGGGGCTAQPYTVSTPWLVQLDADGDVTWQQTAGAQGAGSVVRSVAVDPQGDVVAIAEGETEAISCLAPTGKLMWRMTIPTFDSSVFVDASADVYLTGAFLPSRPPDFGGGYLAADPAAPARYLAKLDELREHIYSEGFSVGEDPSGSALATDASGHVWWLVGYGAAFSTDLGPAPGPGNEGSVLLARFGAHTMLGEPRVTGKPAPGGG
jgi:hypothetical protein